MACGSFVDSKDEGRSMARRRMHARATLLAVLLAVQLLAGCTTPDPLHDAMDYLAAELPDQDMSGRILILAAVAATEQDVHAWPTPDAAIGDDLGMPESYGDQLRMLWALATAGAPEEAWADLRDAVWDGYDGEQFGSPASIMDDAMAFAALVAAGEDPTDDRLWATGTMLRQAQADDGGWRYDGGAPGEPDETAMVLRALDHAHALDHATEDAAEAFLLARQAADGSYDYGGFANCQSTGLAMLAWMHVAGEVPDTTRAYVVSCQNDDGGFPYLKGDPSQVWATSEIVQGLAAAS